MIEPTHPLCHGIEALQKWLEENGLTANRFAIQIGVDPSILGKLMRGKTHRMSLDVAYLIEKGTKGAVPYTVWLSSAGAQCPP